MRRSESSLPRSSGLSKPTPCFPASGSRARASARPMPSQTASPSARRPPPARTAQRVAYGLATQLCLDEDITQEERLKVIDWMIAVGLPVTLEELGLAHITRGEIMDVSGTVRRGRLDRPQPRPNSHRIRHVQRDGGGRCARPPAARKSLAEIQLGARAGGAFQAAIAPRCANGGGPRQLRRKNGTNTSTDDGPGHG